MNNDEKTPRVIETASATTSSDNQNSGPFAYIVTAIALGALLLISLVGAGCTSVVLAAIASDYRADSYVQDPTSYNDMYDYPEDLDLDDWEQWLQYYDDPTSTPPAHGQEEGPVTVGDALDYDLAPFGSTIDGELSASAYSGTPTAVRDFVRSVVTTDREHTTQLVILLNEAALNEEETAAKLDEAVSYCDEAIAALNALETPAVEGDQDGKVKDALGTAKSDAAHRWELMKQELELLQKSDEVDTESLWKIDDDIVETTESAADHLAEAMSASASL